MFWNRNTKFHQIILIGIFSILIGSSEPFRKLSPDENQDRLKNCGNFKLQKFPDSRFNEDNQIIFNDTSVFDTSVLDKLVATTGVWINNPPSAFYATATAISPYHIFTSSYVVLDEEKKWRYTQKQAKCTGSADIDVPSDVLKAFTDLPLTGAKILNICNSTNQIKKYSTRKLMIAEIKEGNFNNYFCLAYETNIKYLDTLYSYGRAWDPASYRLYLRKLKFHSPHEETMVTFGYKAKGDFASALVKEKDGKHMLLAIGMGFEGQTTGEGQAEFYSMEHKKLKNKICELAGICDVPIITTTTSTTPPTTTTTTTTTTTQTPTTPSTSSEEPNTTISATSATIPQPKPLPTSIPSKAPESSEPLENPNRRLEMDVDEEYEEYLARKKESEKDYEDVDDDIVSIDFILAKLPDNEFNKDNETILNDTGILKELVNYTGVWIDNPQSAFYAKATATSQNHVLTSSYVVLDEEMKWRYIRKTAKCPSGSVDLDVPPEVLAVFNRTLRLAEARILNVCNSSNQLVEDFTRKLMLAEIEGGNFNNYFCLANEITSQHGSILYSYGRAWDPNYYQLYVRKLTFDKLYYDIIVTKGYKAKDDFASALVEEKDGKHMILGIGMGFKGQTTGEGQAWFYSIVKFQEKICALAGICDVPIITTTTSTTPPTTTTTTTTQTPTTPSTTSEKPNTTTSTASATIPLPKPSPTSIQSKTPESSEPQENPNRRLEMDVDEEYEEYLARKKESEKDYEDVDDDIVVSRDFFAKAGQRELSVFVLVLIIVIGFA